MNGHRVLVVRPNDMARRLGFVSELQVGWKHGESVLWFGSCKGEAALASLIADARRKHGPVEVERRPA